MRLAIIHYSCPPTIGGVESILAEHARLFAADGHEVIVVTGTPQPCLAPVVRSVCIPELSSAHPKVVAAQRVAEKGGEFGLEGDALARELTEAFAVATAGCDAAIVHNLLTMPFNLAATRALLDLAARRPAIRWFDWIHDVAAANPDHHIPGDAGSPFALLRTASPHFVHVAVSGLRHEQFASACRASCKVIPNGLDPAQVLQLTPGVAALAADLWQRDIILLHPARTVRRKNIESGIRAVARLRDDGLAAALLLTAPPDPHQGDSLRYASELRALAAELAIADRVHFVSDRCEVAAADLASLYRLADVLFFPSKQEGFGLPPLEAAMHRIPVVCSDIEPHRDHSAGFAHFIAADASPQQAAQAIREAAGSDPFGRRRKAVIREYGWEGIYLRYLAPLLCESGTAD